MLMKRVHNDKLYPYMDLHDRVRVPSPDEMATLIAKIESSGGPLVPPGFVDVVRKGIMRQRDFLEKMGWQA